MKEVIRRGIFETNSSSVHSLTMCSDDEYSKWRKGELYFDRYAKEFDCCPETVRSLCKNDIHKYYHNRIKKMLNYKWEYLDTESSIYVSSVNKKTNDKIYNCSEEWEKFYMGDDGTFTFYIDLVNQTFSKNSVIAKTKSIPINGMTIDEMFEVVKTTNWED